MTTALFWVAAALVLGGIIAVVIGGLPIARWRVTRWPRRLELWGGAAVAEGALIVAFIMARETLPVAVLTVAAVLAFPVWAWRRIPGAAAAEPRRVRGLLVAVPLGAVGLIVAMSLLSRPLCASSTRCQAYRAAIRSDLRNLEFAQEEFLRMEKRYARGVEELGQGGFEPSLGVTLVFADMSADGYRVRGTHAGWPDGWCVLAVGAAADTLPPGKPVCHGRVR